MAPISNCSTMIDCITTVADDRKITKKTKGRIALIVSFAMILLFLLYVGPRLEEHIPLFKPVAQYIEEHNIEANMYFYTEVEVFSDAQINMMNTMAHMPGQTAADTP